MIGGRRPLQGRKAGDRRVRVDRPHAPYFRYTGPGQLVAREAASVPRTARGRALARLRAVVFGRPLSNEEEMEERLSKKKALAIFSSDAISLVRLRDRGDPARPGRRRRGRLARLDPGVDRDRAPPGGGLGLVPAGLSGLSERRRCVHRRPNEPRPDLRADRGRGAADRLRHDGRGLDRGGDRPDPVGLPGGVRHPDRDRVRVDRR